MPKRQKPARCRRTGCRTPSGRYWRLVRERNGKPTTLFHGVRGSCLLPLDTWTTAEIRTVHDGSRAVATPYKSGFHVMASRDELIRFAGRFRKRDNLFIVQVDVAGLLWDKAHSHANVLLAERMRIRTKYWRERLDIRRALPPADTKR